MNWIRTTERMPEFDTHVLVWCQIYGRFIASYERIDPEFDYGNWRHNNELGILPPLYWMPLPEPPKID